MTDATVVMPMSRLVERVLNAAVCGRRYVLGIAGPPAAGKSRLSVGIRDALNAHAGSVIAEIAPMDGFHLSNAVLRASGKLARKGGPDTFDVSGYLETLSRLRSTPVGEPVAWPTFDRAIEEPTPSGVIFDRHTIAITEGNYLLLDDLRSGSWSGIRKLLDECWYLDADRNVIEKRLVRRHIRGGMTLAAAKAKTRQSDLPNADLIAATKSRADLVLQAYNGRYHAIAQ
ncbi:nucleoside/nucleotide kinase family protein [Nocardia australiensis]|uniref:nucleoside/nucleotide kinase family protein n=1 Tax=Nocardia australiensis TaxID=2887191 RepID=UPI001D133176|nr:nucleoside/nucleotide kinase family protein [Nocardia australiensis]